MLQQIFLGFIGLCSGFIIAGGLIGLLIGLSIVPRYAGITHTADHIMLYEDITLFGTELGNLFYLFQWNIPAGTPFLILYGLFSGIFLGGWIMALAEMADILTPNLTEACILTERPFKKEGWSRKEIEELTEELLAMGPSGVVITGVREGQYLVNAVAEREKKITYIRRKKVGTERPGTGDVFSSVVAGVCVRGGSLSEGVALAADFVKDCIRRSEELQIPVENGVCFEELMGKLVRYSGK